MLRYKGKLRKEGGYSLSLVIPSDLVKALMLEENQEVYLETEEGGNEIKLLLK